MEVYSLCVGMMIPLVLHTFAPGDPHKQSTLHREIRKCRHNMWVVKIWQNLKMKHKQLIKDLWSTEDTSEPGFIIGHKAFQPVLYIGKENLFTILLNEWNKNYFVVRNAGWARSRNTWKLSLIYYWSINQWIKCF